MSRPSPTRREMTDQLVARDIDDRDELDAYTTRELARRWWDWIGGPATVCETPEWREWVAGGGSPQWSEFRWWTSLPATERAGC